ncbi:MAG: DMT family transporter [Rhizobiaceae bacterium]|nr:DMT family transporter [Rhizobiaceae bacterium]
MSSTTKAYLLLTITGFGWAANAVAGKFAVGHVGPMTLNFGRWALAFAVIVAVSLPQIRTDWPKIRRNWLVVYVFSGLGFAGFNALLYSALRHTSAINVVIEQAGIPGLIFIGNYLLFRMRLGIGQMAGYMLTLLGVAVTASNGSLTTILDLGLNAGDLLMLLACLTYATYTISLRYKPDIHWKSLFAASAAGALTISAPLMAWEMSSPDYAAPDSIGWAAIVFAALVPSLVSQVLYVRGVELIGPNRASLFINTIPIFGTLLAVIFLREPLLGFHFAALALVVTGIAIAERGRL